MKPKREGFFRFFSRSVTSLWSGMKVTFGYFARPSTVVTQQYPENRDTLKMCDRFRAQLQMIHDENGMHKCTACRICEQACPNGSILIHSKKGVPSAKTELDQFLWRMDSCTFCNMCVMVCPFTVLQMNGQFESSVFDRRLLIYNLARYSGPAQAALQKIADPEERKKLMEAREVFSSHSPLIAGEVSAFPSWSAPASQGKARFTLATTTTGRPRPASAVKPGGKLKK